MSEDGGDIQFITTDKAKASRGEGNVSVSWKTKSFIFIRGKTRVKENTYRWVSV